MITPSRNGCFIVSIEVPCDHVCSTSHNHKCRACQLYCSDNFLYRRNKELLKCDSSLLNLLWRPQTIFRGKSEDSASLACWFLWARWSNPALNHYTVFSFLQELGLHQVSKERYGQKLYSHMSPPNGHILINMPPASCHMTTGIESSTLW